MGDVPGITSDWTETEQWVWERIAAGEPADLNTRDGIQKNLDPCKEEGWTQKRRLSVKFLQTILTHKAFIDSTPYGGVRIVGARVDDAPLFLEHARLQHLFALQMSRVLVDIKCRNLRVDGGFSLTKCFVAGAVDLYESNILEVTSFLGTTVTGEVDLTAAKVGSRLYMRGAICEGKVNLNSVTVERGVFLSEGATFKGEVDLAVAKIGVILAMNRATFKKRVSLNSASVEGGAFLRNGSTFKGDVNLGSTKIGSNLEMGASTFEGNVNLGGATIEGDAFLRDGATFKGNVYMVSAKFGSCLDMHGAFCEGKVNLNRVTIEGSAFLSEGAVFKGGVDLRWAKIDSSLNMNHATFEGSVDLTGCNVTGGFLLSISEATSARWIDGASLTLRNATVGSLQDWWRSESSNAWPVRYHLEGFTYSRLGSLAGRNQEVNMSDRPVASCIQWLDKAPGSSTQPYEQLAGLFREAGELTKSTDVLYAAKERRRRNAWSTVDDYGRIKERDWLRALGLLLLRVTIGYGLGNRYFHVLWWVAGFALLGTVVLMIFGSSSPASWYLMPFASLDQLLPIITLDKAHDALIFGDASVMPQPYGVRIYFYLHKIAGWVLGSFLVAGLAGLTQRN